MNTEIDTIAIVVVFFHRLIDSLVPLAIHTPTQVLRLHVDYFATPSSTKPTRPKSKLFGHSVQLHGGTHHTSATRQGHTKESTVSISGRLHVHATKAEPGSNSLFQHGHQCIWVCAPRVLFSEDGPHTLQRQCVHVQKGVQKAGGALYLAWRP